MTDKDTFSCMVGAYFGVMEMDDYPLKEYVLFDLEQYITSFVKNHSNPTFSYMDQKEEVIKNATLKTKLQDALLILPKIDADLEFILMIKAKLRELAEEEK